MNDSAVTRTHLGGEQVLSDELKTRGFRLRFSDPDPISDEDLGLSEIGIDSEPDKPGGQIVFDTADYATDEEAVKAMEALFLPDREDVEDELAPPA